MEDEVSVESITRVCAAHTVEILASDFFVHVSELIEFIEDFGIDDSIFGPETVSLETVLSAALVSASEDSETVVTQNEKFLFLWNTFGETLLYQSAERLVDTAIRLRDTQILRAIVAAFPGILRTDGRSFRLGRARMDTAVPATEYLRSYVLMGKSEPRIADSRKLS